MDKISGIYKIINKIDGKYYVGSSKSIMERWKKHFQLLKKGNHDNSRLQNAFNKYGENNFELQIIEKLSEEQLMLQEQIYLDTAKMNRDKCYNLSFISDKVEMTSEVRNKIR